MTLEWTRSAEEWAKWCSEANGEGTYLDLGYAQIWEDEEGGEAIGVRYEGSLGTVLYPLLRQPLVGVENRPGCDLRVAYDFGGPLVLGPEPAKLLDTFDLEFRQLAQEWGAVTEFARLHPLREPIRPADANLQAEHFIVDLRLGYEAVYNSYHSSYRGCLKQAGKAGLETRITPDPSPLEVDTFVRLYEETMERVGASARYRFRPETLRRLALFPTIELASAWDGEQICSTLLALLDGQDIFYHLAASDPTFRKLRPNHLLLDALIRRGIEAGCRFLHLGGGHESLRHFKAQIATGTTEFWLLKRVHDPDRYREICADRGVGPADAGFPAYRATP